MASTIKDIASALGISPSTVSRALNDHPQINEETKKAVNEIAKKLNYRTNKVAAGLRTHKTYCLGVVVPHIAQHFFSSVLSGIQKVASEHQYQLLICQTNESQKEERQYLEALVAGRVDGILLSISEDTENIEHLNRVMEEMPLVLFDRTSDQIKTIHVEAEDYRGAYMATKHLIDKGQRVIGHLAGPRSLTVAQNRLKGYKDALEANKIPFRESLVEYSEFENKEVSKNLKRLLNDHPDIEGLFTVNDELAVGSILAFKEMNIKVPDQISVVGFGNYPIAEIICPKLTTISHHSYHIGARATYHLLSLIDKKPVNKNYKEVIPSELIIRDSA